MNNANEARRFTVRGAMRKIAKYLTIFSILLLACLLLGACTKTPPEIVDPGTTPETPEEPDEPKVFAPKNVIMISVQDLGDGMIGGDYYGTPLTPA